MSITGETKWQFMRTDAPGSPATSWKSGNGTWATGPTKGRAVKVIRGRKEKGREGVIFWTGAVPTFATKNSYHPVYEDRVGIRDSEGNTFFVPAYYVEVTSPSVVDEAEVERIAE